MSTSRMEAFSDGVIAVAITLLSLGLAVPNLHGQSLGHGLAQEWPRYVAYGVSFLTIGIIWINHHMALSRLRVADHQLMILNLLLLMSIGAIPFATDLMARYLTSGHEASLATAVYCGVFAWMGVAFSLLNWFILFRRAHFLDAGLPLERRRRILIVSTGGVLPYLLAFGVAFLSAYVALGICAALAFYYALPVASGGGPS